MAMRRRTKTGANGLWLRALNLGWDAQGVVALRLLRLARGGARAKSEAGRMVSEKVFALAEAQRAIAAAALTGRGRRLPGKLLQVFGKRVRKNKRRLARW